MKTEMLEYNDVLSVILELLSQAEALAILEPYHLLTYLIVVAHQECKDRMKDGGSGLGKTGLN